MKELMVKGFRASAVAADIKGKGDGRLDMAAIVADDGASAAGVFTRNAAAAAPVHLCRERLRSGMATAVLVNSGNANCMTGTAGKEDAVRLCRGLGKRLDIPETTVLPCSTGVIGVRLPVARMESSLNSLVRGLSSKGLGDVSRAILTTDTVPKTTVREVDLGGGTAVIAGIAKGAGMIAPDMATMLGFILTDASLDGGTLGPLLSNAVGDTFNAITVDGDMSTNDTVLLLASGKGPEVLTAGDLESFSQGVRSVCGDLSEMIVADGEGSRKVVTVRVTGARDAGDARKAAKAVAESLLVKTALAAEDPNWGRIAAAAGYSGALMDPASMGLSIGEVQVLRGGELVAGYREEEAVQVMARDRYDIHLDLGKGGAAAEVRTCDLTEEYVRINCEYRS